ncbi:MAG: hypothetical protein IKT39_01220 [Clostridia bacterium]|nr:hypothetical protein [Clostridia bacterium]
MKKIISILLLCLLLTGCTDKAINGGFGGKPKEIVGEKSPIHMLRINGELYYDTGTFSDMVPRCGTLDGSLLNVADEYEVPKKDNGTNFGPTHTTYFGYQTGFDEYCVEVPIDGGWKIFRKITDPEFKLKKYKYCMYLKGTLPNAQKETQMIVLANDKELDFADVAYSMFSSHSDDYIDKYVIFPDEENLSWGIHLEAEDATPTGLELEISQSGGYPSGELQTGAWYEIEKFDGEWLPVAPIIDNYAWNAIAYLIPKNGEYEAKINWEWLYGKLPKGNYRLAKEITDFRETGDFDKRIFYAYFEID